MVRCTVRISQKQKRPLVMLLISNEPLRLCERDDYDSDSVFFELIFDRLHLSEVFLAGQSGQMPKKDQKRQISHVFLQFDRPTLEI